MHFTLCAVPNSRLQNVFLKQWHAFANTRMRARQEGVKMYAYCNMIFIISSHSCFFIAVFPFWFSPFRWKKLVGSISLFIDISFYIRHTLMLLEYCQRGCAIIGCISSVKYYVSVTIDVKYFRTMLTHKVRYASKNKVYFE